MHDVIKEIAKGIGILTYGLASAGLLIYALSNRQEQNKSGEAPTKPLRMPCEATIDMAFAKGTLNDLNQDGSYDMLTVEQKIPPSYGQRVWKEIYVKKGMFHQEGLPPSGTAVYIVSPEFFLQYDRLLSKQSDVPMERIK